MELDTKEAVGKEHKAWYPLKPAGEVHLSLKWNTVEVKVHPGPPQLSASLHH